MCSLIGLESAIGDRCEESEDWDGGTVGQMVIGYVSL